MICSVEGWCSIEFPYLPAAETCITDCAPYKDKYDPHCGTNGKTYPNRCELYNDMCRTKASFRYMHGGECGK